MPMTAAGRDHQVRVMADPSSNGTGLYAPACWIGVSEHSGAITGDETSLPGEITDGSMARAQGTLVHSTGTALLVVTRTVVADRSVTLRKVGLFTEASGGVLFAISMLNQPAVMVSGDQMPFSLSITLA